MNLTLSFFKGLGMQKNIIVFLQTYIFYTSILFDIKNDAIRRKLDILYYIFPFFIFLNIENSP